MTRSQIKPHGQQTPALPTQLPATADLPACTGKENWFGRFPV